MPVITSAFEVAARSRLRVLGMEQHLTVAMKHPLVTRSEAEIKAIATELVEAIVRNLTRAA